MLINKVYFTVEPAGKAAPMFFINTVPVRVCPAVTEIGVLKFVAVKSGCVGAAPVVRQASSAVRQPKPPFCKKPTSMKAVLDGAILVKLRSANVVVSNCKNSVEMGEKLAVMNFRKMLH